MFQSISRGWALTKTAFKVLSLDKEILALPLLAGVTLLAMVVGVGYGAFGLDLLLDASGGITPLGILIVFGIYVLGYAIVIFFNAAVIEMATIRFNGGDPVLKDGLSMASSRLGRILQWAVVAATVGIIFRILRDQARESFIAQLFVGLLEGAWNVITFFVVPIAIYEDVGPIAAIKRSTSTVKRTFGESIGGIVTTGIIFFLLGLIGLVPFFLGLMSGDFVVMAVLVSVAVLYWVALAAVNSAVDGILVAALYKYAKDGRMPEALATQGVTADNLAW